MQLGSDPRSSSNLGRGHGEAERSPERHRLQQREFDYEACRPAKISTMFEKMRSKAHTFSQKSWVLPPPQPACAQWAWRQSGCYPLAGRFD